ncbi:predicted protein [Nematostella vectensis]|uniref:Methyltransferase type 11 domain-containing protein n=1 Tax=Nematostella vectensis TaxID=45351 RepID=A7S108_NEMVE|nr:predicted protein [Nematostella vectensis]|eukprot:XP_001634738.1 predicted protein [Nematostella vectensis]
MASEVKLGSRFTDSKTYENVRPSYTREPVEFLLKKIGALNEDGTPCNREFKILELGAGTGKFTRVVMEVLEKNPNFQVIASEPLPEMCHKFKEVLPGVEVMQFAAEDIPFPDATFDSVLASSSIHWFSNHKSMQEIHRVLKSAGTLGVAYIFPAVGSSLWIKETLEYLDPVYKRNGILWPALHHSKVIEQVPLDLYFEIGSSCFSTSRNVNTQSMFSYLLSYSSVASLSEEEKEAFKLHYNKTIDKYFTATGKQLQSLEFDMLINCFKRTSNDKNLGLK